MRRAAPLILATTLLGACGGGGPGSSSGGGLGTSAGTGTGPGSGNDTVQGIYYGTFNAPGGGSLPVYGAVLPGGSGLFADVPGDVFVLPPLGTPSNITGSMLGYAGAGRLFTNGATAISYNLTGSASSPNSSSVDAVIDAQVFYGSLQGSVQLNLMAISASILPISNLAGGYSGFYWGSLTPVDFTVSAGGTLTGTDNQGCTVTGQLSSASGNLDLYQAMLQITGTGCPGGLSGVAWDDTDDRGGVLSAPTDFILYIVVSNGATGRVLELQR